MFRALMYQINQSFDIERDVKIRYLLIVLWNSDVPKNTFGGVKLEEIPKFKKDIKYQRKYLLSVWRW